MFGTMFGSSNTSGQSSNSPFGSPSVFGQNNNANNNPFAQKPFGSPSPFGAQTEGSSFGGTYTGVFGSSPVFGPSSTPAFWSSMPAFGASSSPAFGALSSPAFGGTSAFGQEPAFGGFGLYTIIPAFYIVTASSTPAFGSSPAPAFGAASSPFGIGSSPAFGQSASAFGSSPFGTATSAFGAPSSPFGSQTTTPAFGSPGFGQSSGQRVGSRVTTYAQTPEVGSGIFFGKLVPISAMPAYKEKSHEELRWEDYQSGDKGGPNPAGQSSGGMGFGTNNDQQSNHFSSSSAFNQMSSNPFSSTTSTNPFAPKTSTFRTPGFGSSIPSLVSSPFGAATSNPFASTPTPTPSVTSPSLFGTPNTSTFGTTSIFGTNQPQRTSFSTSLNFANTQSSPLSQSSTPTLGQTSSPFRQSNFGQPVPAFSAPAFDQSNAFAGNMFSSTPSLNTSSMAFNPTTPSVSKPFQSAQPTQNSGGFVFPAPGDSSHFNFWTGGIGQGPTLPQQQSITNLFGGPATTPAFGSPDFGQSFGQRVGSRVTPYAQTPEANSGASGTAVGKLESISAMPAYKEKSHEELRWEDYQSGDKGGLNTAGHTCSKCCGYINTSYNRRSPFFGPPACSASPLSSFTRTNIFDRFPKTTSTIKSMTSP